MTLLRQRVLLFLLLCLGGFVVGIPSAKAEFVKQLVDGAVLVREDSAALLKDGKKCKVLRGFERKDSSTNIYIVWKTWIAKRDKSFVHFVIPSDENLNKIRNGIEVLNKKDLYLGPFYFCTESALKTFTIVKDPLKAAAEDSLLIKTLTLLTFLLVPIARLGTWLLYVTSNMLDPLLKAGSFITHPLVIQGWPFVQGVANLGFIIALLFIAFATALQIEGFAVRRMLPRLLAAALLINFSLVLCGLLIDLSRLFMAIMYTAMGAGKLNNLGAAILNSSFAFQIVFEQLKDGSSLATTSLADRFPTLLIEATVMIWGLALGFIALVVALLIRYVALVLLLIISPLAFLAYAFPGTGSMAEKWGSYFLKYVFYGPAALFILVLFISVMGVSPKTGGPARSPASVLNIQTGDSILQGAISIAVVVAFMVAAATVGKMVGVAGSAATLGMIKGQGKKLLRAPFTHPKTTAAVIAGAATGGLGAIPAGLAAAGAAKGLGAGGRFVKDRVRYAYGDAKRYAGERFKKALPMRPIERDATTGKPKPGETSTVTSLLVKAFGRPITSGQHDEATKTTAAINSAGPDPTTWSPDLNATALRQGYVTGMAGTENILNKNITQNTDKPANVRALIENDDFMRSLNSNPAQQIRFINQIQANTNLKVMPDLSAAQRAAMSPAEIGRYEERQRDTGLEERNRLSQRALEAVARLRRLP